MGEGNPFEQTLKDPDLHCLVEDEDLLPPPPNERNEEVEGGEDDAQMKKRKGGSVSNCHLVLAPHERLYRLMKLTSDRQDRYLVDKVVLNRKHILALCAALSAPAEEAVFQEHDHRNFESPLNHKENRDCSDEMMLQSLLHSTAHILQEVIGYYGDRRVMQQLLTQKVGIDNELLRMGTLSSGLYACLLRSVLHVFLWLPSSEDELREASRKDLACNLVRYLTELCSTVRICLPAELTLPTLKAVGVTSEQSRRVHRLKICRVKDSEDDITISPGFSLHLMLNVSRSTDTSHNDILLSEGSSRCALLFSHICRKSPPTEKIERRIAVGNLVSLIRSWESSYDVNFRSLPDEEFLVFLEQADPESFAKYQKMHKRFQYGSTKCPGYGLEHKLEGQKIQYFEQEKSRNDFLDDLKYSMGMKRGRETTYSILHIAVKEKKQNYKQISRGELSLTVQCEFGPRDYVLWKAVELVPMSNDIKEASLHSSDHNQQKPLIPKASAESQFEELELGKQKLLKCILLKSSDVLFFLQNVEYLFITIHWHSRLGCRPTGDFNRITTIWRGCDIIAFDESSRTTAFYDKSITTVKFYRFDEAFQHCDWTGVEITLTEFSGSSCIQWMELIPGKREVVLIDDSWRVRVFEIAPSAVMKPKHIKLPGPFVKAVISTDGSCLICLYPESGVAVSPVGSSEAQSIAGTSGRPKLQLKVYLLGDSLSHLKDVPADLSFPDMTKLDARVVLFGSQMHLVIHSSESPEDIISLVLGISSMKESIKMKEVGSSNFSRAMETKPGQSCPHLGYIFHIYDKFPTCPPLVDQQRSLELTLLLAQTSVQRTTVACNVAATPSDCKDYVQAFLKKLAKKGKSFENLQITVSSYYLDEFLNSPTPVSRNNDTAELVGAWISKLLSLVPVQIACAENNSLRPLINGLEINSNLTFQDAVSMSNLIQFGFYDLILNSWNGNITVISSMGKQSSGKSYLLNHVTGSLFDVAGGRCTAGLWMTTRIRSDCLYVLLDFEGLGSFERSDQEDMLLSLLSAAMSNVTLFNKKDFHLDKETELLFDRFQSGVDLVKQDSKLFRGLFYIAIKDVDAADTDDLTREFDEKIQQMCSKSNDNFLLKMYNGDVQIETMAPFRSTKYQKSLRRITNTIQHIGASYSSGRSFMRDMKLLIAQICTKDWSPLDDKRAALRVSLLKQHFTSAVRMGCLCTDSGKKSLISLDTEDEIEDSLLQQVGDVNVANLELADTGLELLPFHSITMPGSILQKLKYEFEKIVLRTGEKDEIWFALFEKFLLALVERRKKRVFLWLECNSCDFSEDGDFQKLKSEAKAALAELKEGLTPCSTKCSDCFLKCVLEKGHDQCCHSCKGSHICTSLCSFCVEKERDTAVVEQCTDVSGHGGPHDCKKKNHTCVEDCHFAASSSNCNKSCALKVGHADHHHCNSLQHTCKMVCDALECRNTCIFPLENGDHEKHACHRTFCLSKCSIPSCHRSCAKEDHFHASDPQAKHFCENEHLCQHDCEGKGTCEVLTELVKQTRVYPGKKGSFEYQYQSEQNGLRKGCCIVIPAFRDKHDGMHMHTTNPDAVHYCDKRCPSCGYFCNLEFGHDSVHRTTHGNMRLTRFVAESEDINIEGRMYEWGESGKAEMCMMHCKSRGRGHIHLIPCPVNKSGVCTKMLYGEEARHQTRTYGPDSNICKDEMTHKTYWEHIRFLDPCTKEEQTSFALCDYYCSSEKHKQESRSYCTEKLWHASLQASSKGVHSSTVGFVLDGHQFDCNHEDMYMAFVIIFVIDVSRSMHKSDVTPSNEDLAKRFPSRLGCVFESIDKFLKARAITVDSDRMSVILFAYSASVAVDLKAVDPNNILNEDLYKKSKSNWLWTRYASGLEEAENLLDKLAETKEIQQTERSTDKTKQVNVREAKDSPTQAKKPIIIFLSDGVNRSGNDPIECVEKMKKKYGDLVLHTILFNKKPKNTEEELLKKMAESAGGRYYLSQDQLQLDRSFTGIVQSLRPMTSVAMNRTSRNF